MIAQKMLDRATESGTGNLKTKLPFGNTYKNSPQFCSHLRVAPKHPVAGSTCGYGIVDAEVRTARQEPVSSDAKQHVAVQSARKCQRQQKWREKPSAENTFIADKHLLPEGQMSGKS